MSDTQSPIKSPEEILAEFKAEWVNKEGAGVLDAWLDDGWIKYHLDPEVMMSPDRVRVPFEYQGISTVLTLFPRED